MADRTIEPNSSALIFVEKEDGSTSVEILYPENFKPENSDQETPKSVGYANLAMNLLLEELDQ